MSGRRVDQLQTVNRLRRRFGRLTGEFSLICRQLGSEGRKRDLLRRACVLRQAVQHFRQEESGATPIYRTHLRLYTRGAKQVESVE